MQGILKFRFNAPNVARLRSRVTEPSKELSSQLRDIYTKAACEVINENQLAIRTKVIDAVGKLGLNFSTEAHKAQVNNLMGSIFDIVAAPDAESLAKLTGAAAPAPKDAPKAKPAPKAKAKAEPKEEAAPEELPAETDAAGEPDPDDF